MRHGGDDAGNEEIIKDEHDRCIDRCSTLIDIDIVLSAIISKCTKIVLCIFQAKTVECRDSRFSSNIARANIANIERSVFDSLNSSSPHDPTVRWDCITREHEATMQPRSSIGIDKLSIPLPHGIGLSAFSLDRQPCYVLLSLTCHLKPECLQPSASNGGLSDDWDCLGIGKSVNYSALGKTLYSVLSAEQGEGMTSLSDLARTAAEITAGDYSASLLAIDVVVERPKALLFSDSVNVHRRFGVKTPEGEPYNLRDESHTLVIQDLRVDTVIGLHPHEREEAQRLVVDIEMDMMRMPVDFLRGRYGFDYKSLGRFAYEVSPFWRALNTAKQARSTSVDPRSKPSKR